ncbi:MSEP-CTERM sorting domain-containing protein [Hymenobacter cellulosivorans]|uniref:MSEP-CTERM sorting domain-containing protein n=1 Tax=Hymenobacter cellulosivorans TaxID=2932249 RepID=A0ABY4FHW5_9BACT|nr:MSEP-CTERM sorting domain-containing protein [Hymenobacter cellulosivorans]UOQ55532.1 MSEP-CTERM sorting domain-containing protein [Hymenobacter cellulosivorans]
MRNLLNPKWLLLLNTLPLVLLAALCYAEFTVVHSLLPAPSVALWGWFGLVLAGLGLSTLGYALVQIQRSQPVGVAYCVLALAAHSAFIMFYLNLDTQILPRDVPRWMVPTDLLLYVGTFLMPTLAYAVFALVVRLTPTDPPPTVAINFLLAFVGPLAWYILLLVPFSALQGQSSAWLWETVFPLILVSGVVGFLFFLVRGVYIMGLRRAEDAEFHFVWKLLVSLLLPLMGLLVNNGLFWGGLSSSRSHEEGVFGNFNSPWFYILAVLNGVLLCMPDQSGRWTRLAVFLGRSVLLSYTFYFFVVFLPYLPLSILAILLIGLGFLMLTPLVLLVVHVRELSTDLDYLQRFFSRSWLRACLVAGALTLPLIITGSYLHNRWMLHQALAYRYTPDYSRRYDLDAAALANTLNIIKDHKERPFGFSMGRQVPYLSTLFNWLVLDNLTLSDDKIASLEQLFLGTEPEAAEEFRNPGFTARTTRPVLSGLTARTHYDAAQQAWVSWLDLQVNNTDSTETAGEYATTLTLPVGCFVSGYYLDMNGRREPGILSEKKAAAWVYAQIVNETQVKDPGLLAYDDQGRLNLRVYPVVRQAARTTGLQLLHKEPVVLTVDGRRITLGDSTARPLTATVLTPDKTVAYISAAAKQRLPLVRRTPYYHFLLDVSAAAGNQKAAYARRVASLRAQQGGTGPARFTLVDAYATPVRESAQWQNAVAQHESQGGFYLDGALRQLLFDTQQHPSNTYPIIVVVTDNLNKAILGPGLAELSSAYPESDQFFVLAADGSLEPHSLRQNMHVVRAAETMPAGPRLVRAWPTAARPQAYLPDNAAADIVLNRARVSVPAPGAAGSRWQTGLLLHGYQQWQAFHPEATNEQRVPFLRASFRTGIMTSFTAYLALENAAQKAALARKQEQVINANAALDLDESPADTTTNVPIDEEVWVLLAAGLLLAFWQLRRTMQIS